MSNFAVHVHLQSPQDMPGKEDQAKHKIVLLCCFLTIVICTKDTKVYAYVCTYVNTLVLHWVEVCKVFSQPSVYYCCIFIFTKVLKPVGGTKGSQWMVRHLHTGLVTE